MFVRNPPKLTKIDIFKIFNSLVGALKLIFFKKFFHRSTSYTKKQSFFTQASSNSHFHFFGDTLGGGLSYLGHTFNKGSKVWESVERQGERAEGIHILFLVSKIWIPCRERERGHMTIPDIWLEKSRERESTLRSLPSRATWLGPDSLSTSRNSCCAFCDSELQGRV